MLKALGEIYENNKVNCWNIVFFTLVMISCWAYRNYFTL